MTTMEHKAVTYFLDAASGIAFILGWVRGEDILMFLGACASIAAILNHGSAWLSKQEWWQKYKNRKK